MWQTSINYNKIAKAGVELWNTMAASVKCKLHDFTIAVPEFQRILKEVKYPESVKDQEVRVQCFVWKLFLSSCGHKVYLSS